MYAGSILASALSVGFMDFAWLTFRSSYHDALFQSVQGSRLQVRVIPAIGIYVLLPIAIYLYAVRNARTMDGALRNGALLGFILYAFYDLTNYATLKGWTLEMTVTDIAWGILVCSLGAGAGHIFHSST